VVALFLKGESKAMTQSELNRQIAKQTGESIADIARLGFTILTELPRDEDDEHQQSRSRCRVKASLQEAVRNRHFSIHHRIAVQSVFTQGDSMSVKLNIGLSRKVGEANYGSRGASINLEVELDNGMLNDPDQLRERVHDLYVLARQSVDEELQRPAEAGPSEFSHGNGNGNGSGRAATAANCNGHANGHAANGNGNSNGYASHGNSHSNGQHGRVEVARATQSQIRAIFAISKRQGLDPKSLVSERYRVYRMEDLTIREASTLIDELKNGVGVRS
jgi:hypothetical protein